MTDEKPALNAAADDYFRALAGLKYPQALATNFPRIVNTLFEIKDNKVKLRDYFGSLIEDVRGGRQGFPFEVLLNIQDLREAMLGDVNQFVSDDTTKWVS